jgi:hypothetical protein
MYLLCHFFLTKQLKEVMLDETIAFDNWLTLLNDSSITMSIDTSTSTSSLYYMLLKAITSASTLVLNNVSSMFSNIAYI